MNFARAQGSVILDEHCGYGVDETWGGPRSSSPWLLCGA